MTIEQKEVGYKVGKPSLRRRCFNDSIAETDAQQKRILDAIALCDCKAAPQELADAFAICEAAIEPFQKELLR